MTTPTLEPGTPESLLDDQIEPFLKHLRAAGYAERTLRKKRTVAKASVRWTRRKQIAVKELDDDHIFAFAARSPRRRKAHVKFERAVMRLFFEYLRGYVGLQRPSSRDCVSHPFELAVFHMRGLGRAESPCSRAASAAAVHNARGIGKRALCPFRQRSKRRQTLRMRTGISTGSLAAMAGPPRPAGRKTDVITYGWAESCRLAGASRNIGYG